MQTRRQGLVLDDHPRPVSGEGVEGGDCAPHGGIGGAVGEGAVAASSLQAVHARGGARGAVANPVDFAQGPPADDGDAPVQPIRQPPQHLGPACIRPYRVRRRRQGRQHTVQIQEQGGLLQDGGRFGQA
ncbi:hypothetical protein D3C86_1486040 [compost metagenome]